jgi:hypothetical protein
MRETVGRIRPMTPPGSSVERKTAGASGSGVAVSEMVSGIAQSRILSIRCDEASRKMDTTGKGNRMAADWERKVSDADD